MSNIERKAAYFQGKGWGSATISHEFKAAVSTLGHDDVKLCIDIGGNKGLYSAEILKQYPNSKLVIFEPSELNAKILHDQFGGKSNVVIEKAAVSNANGDATLFSNESGSGLASLTKRRLDHHNLTFEVSENVQTIVFEDYWKSKLNSQHIDICKIDIEGHELDALNGFGAALQHVDVIQFEFGGCNIDTRTYFQDFWYFFQKAGFDIYRISPFGAVKVKRYREKDETFTTTNFLAKRIF
jgi:FkbM family methyltransferase